jgi:redox-sensitive bicupin YhaK (pirin superfamily)
VVHICQDVRLWAGRFDGAEQERRTLDAGRRVYVHVARGALHVNGRPLGAGDAAMLIDEPELTLESGSAAEVLVFDLP